MKINKKLLLIVMTVMLFVFPLEAFSQEFTNTSANGKKQTISVTSEIINSRENQTNISGFKPNISSNDINTTPANDEIDKIYKNIIKSSANSRAKSVVFSYEEFVSKEYLSILINAKVQSGTETQKASAVTIKMSTGEIVKIEDTLGGKPVEVVNSYINKLLVESQQLEKEILIDEDSPFYINKGVPTLLFDSYAIGPKQSKVQQIPINLDSITSFSLPRSEYYAKENFNIRMIPVRKTCEGLYYSISWVPSSRTFIVKDKNTTSMGSPNSNDYIINSKKVSLEYKPEITDNITYVPISYFTDVLGLSYKIDKNGDITFYKI